MYMVRHQNERTQSISGEGQVACKEAVLHSLRNFWSPQPTRAPLGGVQQILSGCESLTATKGWTIAELNQCCWRNRAVEAPRHEDQSGVWVPMRKVATGESHARARYHSV